MSGPVTDLLDLLDLEPIEVNIFRGEVPMKIANGCSGARSWAKHSSPRNGRSTTIAKRTRSTVTF